MNIISIITNTKEKKLIIELEDNSTKDYTDKESFIMDYPEMEAHWIALEESIKNSILTPEIAKDKIRAIREPKFKQLDLDFLRALETGSDTTLIVQEKQRLRDLTDTVNGKTVEELIQILNELGGN